jgi:hypothetical protein
MENNKMIAEPKRTPKKEKQWEVFLKFKEKVGQWKEKKSHLNVWFRLNGLSSSQNGQNSLIHNWCTSSIWPLRRSKEIILCSFISNCSTCTKITRPFFCFQSLSIFFPKFITFLSSHFVLLPSLITFSLCYGKTRELHV